MIAPEITALRLKLRKAGFHPLPLEGKVPHISEWQQKFLTTNDEEIRNVWPGVYHLAHNTGVLAKFAPGLDIDIMDEAAAEAVEMLAREHFEERGNIHVRFGLRPKRLVVLRTDEPFAKLFCVFDDPSGKEHKIEILGDGQQYVVHGIHPDTHKPYSWFGGDLETIRCEDLPYVRREDAEQFLDSATKLLVEDFGFVLKNTNIGVHPTNGGGDPHDGGEDLRADPELIRAALTAIPNNADWERWYTIGMAVWRATGGSAEGFAAWDEWSKKSPKYNAYNTAQKWAAFFKSSPTRIGAGTIFHLANEASPDWREEYEARQGGAGAGTGGAGIGTAPAPSPLGEWNAAEDVDPPPPRAWLLGNTFCRTFLSSILGSGGVGKTALRYAQALSLATGRELTGEHVFQRCRVLIVSLEDDAHELRRRIRAVRLKYDIPLSELDGWLWLSAPGAKAGKLMVMDKRGRAVPGDLGANLEAVIVAHSIDFMMLDPFIKTHSIEENANSAIDDAAQQLTDLATKYNIAVDAPHHMRKGLMTPGDADSGRGASAYIDAARLVYTCLPMSENVAKAFDISQEDRRDFIRVDSGKPNIARRNGNAKWFHLIGVPLNNATTLYRSGDEVQTVEPWEPPSAWAGTTSIGLNAILSDIDAGLTDEDGMPTGQRYSNAPNATDRAVWPVVQKHYPGKKEAQCREIIHAWLNTGLLCAKKYNDPVEYKERSGLYVDNSKRPS
jgi:hypothetical protein